MVLDVGCYGNGLVMFVNFISLWRYRMKSEDIKKYKKELCVIAKKLNDLGVRCVAHYENDKQTLEDICSVGEDVFEISFKAGYDKRESEFVYNPDYLDFQKGVKSGKVIGEQAGIKKVVDWIEKNNILNGVVVQNYGKWQAKLKEWGLE